MNIFTSRRGVMYTIVAIVILVIVGSIFFTQSRRTGFEATSSSADRVKSLNSFIKSVEHDSARAAYISGFRSMIAMEQYVTSTGSFLPSPDATFDEVFLNGTISGRNFTIMDSSSFNEYLSRVQVNAADQGIDFRATVINITLWQTDPWNVLVNYTLSMNVTDNRGVASWRINKTLTGRIPIVDLRDPLFTARTYGRIQRVIKPTNVTQFVTHPGGTNDTTALIQHFNNSLYIARGRGPAMLMRFSGNLSDSPYGIESLVDVDDFTTQGLTVNSSASVVDFEYFRGTPATACNIQNLPSKIKIDANHIPVYEIDELIYTACP